MADRLQLHVRLDAPRAARVWVCDLCRSHGLEDLSDNAALLVTELVTNAVLHARTDCEVVAEPGEHAIRVDVSDHNLAEVQVHPLDASAHGGRGLWIVAALAAEWGITPHRTGKSVWFTLTGEGHGAGIATLHHTRSTNRGVAPAPSRPAPVAAHTAEYGDQRAVYTPRPV